MSGMACAHASSDLTEVASALLRAGQVLEWQAGLPEEAFAGLAGDAFRARAGHAARAAEDAGRAVGPLAGALADLGRGLDEAAALRRRGSAGDGDEAAAMLTRADRVEDRAQEQWRAALCRFDQARPGNAGSGAIRPGRRGNGTGRR